tara:strand:- start:812 stop:1561 length:750 start_codon:yes stop_codon:yes gene_type:complete
MHKKIVLSIVAISTLFTFSCKKEDGQTLEKGNVNIEFKHNVGSEDLEFNNKKYTNAIGHIYEVRTLKYFISNVTFTKSDGYNEVIKKPIYINASDTVTLIKDNAIQLPLGTYTSIGFTFGLDSTMNVTDTLTSVEATAMAWGMQGGGYHYMKLEGTYDSLGIDSATKNYTLHTGASMGKPYDFHVTFDNSAFTLDQEGLNIQVKMDINEWFTDPNKYDFEEYGKMIMMKMEAQMKLKENGASVFSIGVK